MKITIIGTGYVGLVTGACFAEMGNEVICYDKDSEKITSLNSDDCYIYEPGLEKIIKENVKKGTLSFTNNCKKSIIHAKIIFITVGTPMNKDSSPNIDNIYKVAKDIGKYIDSTKLIVNKSTSPVGTIKEINTLINKEIKRRNKNISFRLASNPEFLKEGNAINDFMSPDRIIIGVRSKEASKILHELYKPFIAKYPRIIEMDIKSAEITKYAANAMLATKISFINEIATICEEVGADINQVRLGIGSDKRIGYDFIFAGIGYGGSCLPKDINALSITAKNNKLQPLLIDSLNKVNNIIQMRFIKRVIKILNNKNLRTQVAIWGLTFKPGTDDMRDAPSINIINSLLKHNYKIRVFDPYGMDNAKQYFEDTIYYSTDMYDALENSEALLLLTEWNEFRSPDFNKISTTLKNKIIFDGRNQFDSKYLMSLGFKYYQIGVKNT